MRTGLILLRVQLRGLLRSAQKGGRPVISARLVGRPLFLGLIAVVFAFQMYVLAVSWASGQAAHAIAFVLFEPLLITLGSAAMIVIFFYGFTNLIGRLTADSDLRLLLVAPISPAGVLGEKLVITALGFSIILLAFVPANFALGSIIGVGADFYPAVLLAILLTPIAPVSLAALLLVALLHWLPPARARSISAVLGTLAGIALFLGSRLLARSAHGSVGTPPAWLPTTWPARFVADVGLGDNAGALQYLFLTIALSAGLFVVAVVATSAVFATGAAGYAETRRSSRPATKTLEGPAAPDLVGKGRSEEAAARRPLPILLRKDVLSLRRDPQRLVALLFPLAIVAFQAVGVLGRREIQGSQGAAIGVIILVLFAALLLVNVLAPNTFNSEGRSLVLLALAPVPPRTIFIAKLLIVTSIPIVVDAVALVGLAVYERVAAGEVFAVAIALVGAILATAGMSLMASIVWPKLDSTSPRRAVSPTAAFLGLISDAAVGVFTGAMLVFGLFVLHGAQAVAALAVLYVVLLVLVLATTTLGPRLLQRLLDSGRLTAA